MCLQKIACSFCPGWQLWDQEQGQYVWWQTQIPLKKRFDYYMGIIGEGGERTVQQGHEVCYKSGSDIFLWREKVKYITDTIAEIRVS